MNDPRLLSLDSSAKWRVPGRGSWYADARFATAAHATRDPRALAALLRGAGIALAGASVLDVGCGTGRLRAPLHELGAVWHGLDASREMLGSGAADPRRVQGELAALPFADSAFDLVVCCRVLHHLRDPHQLERAASELLRVARLGVACSFWDSASWPQLRRRLGLKRDEGPAGRVARPRAELARAFALSGGRVARFRARPRWLDQQTFAWIEKEHHA